MRAEQQAAAKTDDFDPLVPYDVIRPPQQRGTDDVQLGVIPPLEPKEVPESEIEEHERTHPDVPVTSEDPEEEDQAKTHADFPEYKGDRNAPVDAEHPLANSPSEEQLPPIDPRD
jgi:hypothetical protein